MIWRKGDSNARRWVSAPTPGGSQAWVFVFIVAAGSTGLPSIGQDTASRPPDSVGGRAAPGAVIVEGQVTDAVGAGLAGVTITVRHQTEDGEPGEVIATATSDQLGDFAVRTGKSIQGKVVVTLSKPMHVELVRELDIEPGKPPPFLGETLTGELEITGLVTSALNEEPVVGASVTLEAFYQEWHERTDKLGRFTIKGVSPGHGLLIVEAKGFGREQRQVRRLEEPGDIIVSLKPERIVHIEIVDDLGRPVPSVTIECVDEDRGDFRTVMTDDRGTATLRGLHFEADILLVRLTHDEHVSSAGFDETIHPPAEKVESSHRLEMVRAGRIEGRIIDEATGKPLYGARIMTGDGSYDDTPRDWTDYSGLYEVRGVAPGQTLVTAHLSGYAPELNTIEVFAGRTSNLELALKNGTVVNGSVKDEDGKPIAGAEITATRWRGHGTLGLRAMTDRDGRFALGSSPHDEFEIIVVAPGAAPEKLTVPAERDTNLNITLRRAPSGAIPGAVVTLEVGQPVPDVTLKTLTGESLNPAKLGGKTILVDFWATWCAPCVAELPHLIALHEKFKGRQDFAMVGVSRDFDAVDVRGFLKEHPKMTWPQIVGEDGGASEAAEKFGVAGVPTLFVIGPDGRIAAVGVSAEEISQRIDGLLQSQEPQ